MRVSASPSDILHTFDTSVFVNCPFDDEYEPLFRALLFTIEFCSFKVRCSLEVDDSGETRAEKLIRLIEASQFGIHDISRTESNAEGLPRFNMPYEFGVFMGFRHGGVRLQRSKVVLVLDREPYRYQKYLSDIAGQDIKSHGGDPDKLIADVRNWLQNQTTRHLAGRDHIIRTFRQFQADLPALLRNAHKTAHDLKNYRDLLNLIREWIQVNAEK